MTLSKGNKKYEELTSKFYTLVPHDFKRMRPEVISTLEKVQEKKDMLIVLTDIEIAQGIQREQEQQVMSSFTIYHQPSTMTSKIKSNNQYIP